MYIKITWPGPTAQTKKKNMYPWMWYRETLTFKEFHISTLDNIVSGLLCFYWTWLIKIVSICIYFENKTGTNNLTCFEVLFRLVFIIMNKGRCSGSDSRIVHFQNTSLSLICNKYVYFSKNKTLFKFKVFIKINDTWIGLL